MTELAVLVPVLNRPQNVAPLVESFLAGCVNSLLCFIPSVEDREEVDAIIDISLGEESFNRVGMMAPQKEGSWPCKINAGIGFVEADWYLCAADDVRFTPGWWEATKELRDDPRVGCIGTNDSATATGNPRVAAGEHTCHPLIRASYIRDHGTIDQVGVAVHPGYHHWYVDDELIHTAKARHAWAFCRESVVEHLHPYWKKAEWDDTYALGEKHADEDRQLFESRLPLIRAEYEKYA